MHRAIFVVAVAISLFCRVPVAAAGVLLGFCDTYLAPDGGQHVHRGVDVAQAAGTSVRAPLDGTIRFAGMTPGPHGGRVGVVTIETTAGVVSILPVEMFDVEAGSAVRAGEALGSVAATGDPSSSAPHAHIGLKVEGVYIDPSELIVPAEPIALAPVATPATPAPADSLPATTPSLQGAVVAAPGIVAPHVSAARPVSQQAPTPASVVAPPETELAPGVSLAPPEPTNVPGVIIDPEASVVQNPRSAEGRGLMPPLALVGAGRGVAALVCSVLFIAMLMASKSFSSRIGKGVVSDRLGTLLQHLKAGDTLCGLTSCPGPLPSQSRGH